MNINYKLMPVMKNYANLVPYIELQELQMYGLIIWVGRWAIHKGYLDGIPYCRHSATVA